MTTDPIATKLSTIDRFLPLWILSAMTLGLLLGNVVPQLNTILDSIKIGEVSLPIALGLLIMMYPVLAKVRYNKARDVLSDKNS